MLKIIIPLAGSSELFTDAGYFYPKPLIEICGRTMIEFVVKNPSDIHYEKQIVFIIKEDDVRKFHLDNTLKLLCPEASLVVVKENVKGALCSVLMTIDKLNDDDSLLILNGDQVIDIDYNSVLNFWRDNNIDCGIVTFKSMHPRWSYAKIVNEEVIQTAEKNPISSSAIAGYYYFKEKKSFVNAAFQSIKNDSQLNDIFYISTTVNQMILMNKKVVAYEIDAGKYHSFYSPQMIREFEKNR